MHYKFEIFDSEFNDFLLVGYFSQAVDGVSVYINIKFGKIESDDIFYGYDYMIVAEDYEITETLDSEGDDFILSEEQKNLIQEEAQRLFNSYFKDEEYNTLKRDINIKAKSHSFSNGGELNKYFSNPQRFIDYNGQFLYPPRIESKIQPKTIELFDKGEFVAQPKLNGSNTSVTIWKNGAMPKERHNRIFAIPPKFDFTSLHRGNGFMCITGEFMNKSKKDENGKPFRGFCIWDIVAYDGKILLGSTIEERIKLLNDLYPSGDAIKTKDGVTYLFKTNVPDIYKVNNFYDNFTSVYNSLIKVDMIEGFVLKRKNGKLEMMTREQNNTGWAVKVRKPTANYIF